MPTDRALRSFAVRVTFVRVAPWLEVRRAHPENVMAPLDVGQALSLLAARGHAAELIDTETGRYTLGEAARATVASRPDVVVLDGPTPAVPHMLQLADLARERLPDALILAVGQHATARPQDLVGPGRPFDAAALREWEETVTDVCDAVCAGEGEWRAVPGLLLATDVGLRETRERPLQTDLDALPWPDHARFLADDAYVVHHPTRVRGRRRWGFVLGGRGCPHACLHCSPSLRNSYGDVPRLRDVGAVVDELRELQRLGATVVHFKDDTFAQDPEWASALCDRLDKRRLRLPWTVQTRPDRVMDPSLCRAMAQAGCTTVVLGIDSGSAWTLKMLRKGYGLAEVRRGAAAVREAGMLLVGLFLIGCPGESLAEMEETLSLARSLELDLLQVQVFVPYPGSPFYDRWFHSVDARGPDEFSHYNPTHWRRLINLSAVSDEDLLAFQRRFYRETILTPRFAARFLGNRLAGLPDNLGADLRLMAQSARFLFR